MIETYNHVLSNREKVQLPRKGKFWCLCDKQQVNESGICGVCRNNKKHRKRLKK